MYKVEVSTCVLCTSKIKVLKECLSQGFSVYRIKVVRLKDHDADQVIAYAEFSEAPGLSRRRQGIRV